MATTAGSLKTSAGLPSVLAYKNDDIIARYQAKIGLNQSEAEQLFTDTKLFLYLCSIAESSISPSEAIDEGWHHFILFTSDYYDFCLNYFGRFIHHRPKRISDPPTNGEQGKLAFTLAVQQFGENELSGNWHYKFVADRVGSTCDNPSVSH